MFLVPWIECSFKFIYNIIMQKFEENMRVIVPALITGTGEDKVGTISKVETFLGKTIVSVSYDTPDRLGNWGSTITNTSALKIMAKKSEDNNILPQVEEFLKYKQQYPDRILLIDNVSREKGYVAYGEDAVAISKLLGIPLKKGGQTEQGLERMQKRWKSHNLSLSTEIELRTYTRFNRPKIPIPGFCMLS